MSTQPILLDPTQIAPLAAQQKPVRAPAQASEPSPLLLDPTELSASPAASKQPTRANAASAPTVIDPTEISKGPAPAPTPKASQSTPSAPTLSERVGSAIPDWLTPALAAGEKYLVNPFEKMAAAGAKTGSEAATDVTSAMATHPLETLTGAARQAMGLPPTEQEATDLAEVPTRFAKEHPIATGIAQGVGETAGSIAADPRMWALGLGEAGDAALKRLVSAGFSAQMLYGAARSVPGVQDALEKGDHREAARLITEAGINAAFGALSGAHAIAGEKAPVAAAAPTEEAASAAQPRTAAGELPQGKTPAALPPKPGVPEELRTQKGPGKKPIALPAQTATRLGPSGEAIAAPASTAIVEGPRPTAKSKGAQPLPQTAADLKVEIAKLDNRERIVNEQMRDSRPGTDANQKRIQQLRQISARRSELRAKLDQVEPRPAAKPLSKAPGADQPIGSRIGGTPTYAQPRPKAEAPKTPTYDKLPPEMREVADALAKNHNHLPQSLREGDEVEYQKLSTAGTPLKERIARRMARDENLPYADRNSGAMIQPKPEAKPLSDRRTPIGERRLENEPAPEGIERRVADRRAQFERNSREVTRQAIASDQAKILNDPAATEAEKTRARELIDQIKANPAGEGENLTSVDEARRTAQPKAGEPASGAKIGDTVRFRDRQGNELEGKISDRSAHTQMWRVETKGGSVAVPDDRIVSMGEQAARPVGRSTVEELPGGARLKTGSRENTETIRKGEKALVESGRMTRQAIPRFRSAMISRWEEGGRPGLFEDFYADKLRPYTATTAVAETLPGAGAMEQESPLFRDTEASGQKGLFTPKVEKKITLSGARKGTRAEEQAAGTIRHDILADGKRVGEVHVSPKDEALRVTWMGEPLTREGGKPEELDALSNKLGPNGVRQVIRELHRLYPDAEELSYTREGGAAGRSAREHGEVAARTMLLGKGSRLHAGIDPAMVRDLFDKLGRLYDEHIAGAAIEKMGLGRTHKDVEDVDQKLASRIRRYEAAPQYFRTKAEDIANDVTKGLSRKQERLFVLMADEQSRENLRENHPDEYAEALRDKAVQAALDRYKPHAAALTKARTILGGSVMPGDHLPWVYPKHVSGIGQRVAETDLGGGGFDRGITPQRVDQFGRKTTAEYHHKNGLHEFAPAFVRKYAQTMTKIAEHATAMEFLSKATKVEPGDHLPPMITYNGKRFYSPEILQMIREAAPGKASNALAESLGVKTLPKPKEAEAYSVYRPTTAKDAPTYLGPKPAVQALKGLGESNPGRMGPVGRFIQEQWIGAGMGVRHGFNLFRRITQQFPLGVSSPVNWIRAVRVMTDHELRSRALSRTNDPAYDALLRWGGISPEGASSFREYQGKNLNPANWLKNFAKVGNRWLFDPGAVDQRARLWMRDLLKSQRPELSDERAAQLVREALGNYSRQNWTATQKLLSRFLLFPGWDYSSVSFVLRHPIRTAVPPAILIMLVNQAIQRSGGKQEPGDQWDPFAIHVGGHSYGTPGFEEPLARSAAKPIGRAAQALLEGETRRQATGEAARAIPQALAGIAGMTRPDFRLPFEIAANKTLFGKDIVPAGDFTRRGALMNQGAEDITEHALKSFFPLVERATDENQSASDAALSNFGLSRYQETPHRAPLSERQQDIRNVEDDIRALRRQAAAIAEDSTLSEEEKQKRLIPLRQKFQELIKRDRPN